ncbi:hypothetical protein BOTCAL_0806g00020 [Botryotinia calthae]|uniref:F-box domain-containing protein n=1 Tax=Botryotinia calthae TaxID=38488 RepID=A0A4Y8CI08_9HELO|nr:hypothetical protein BOTCAL_0806g00020 [Botryotinia calthae]
MGTQISKRKHFRPLIEDLKNALDFSPVSRATEQPDSTLEKLPTEVLLRIMQSLDVSDVSIAFTCPHIVVTRVCKPEDYDMRPGILNRYEHCGRFLRRPYYDDEENYRDLKEKYWNYELFVHCWTRRMEGVFTYPYPHNKGRVIYDMEMKQEIQRLLDSIENATHEQYMEREFFMKEFVAIGSYKEIKDLILANLSLIQLSQWREMMDF